VFFRLPTEAKEAEEDALCDSSASAGSWSSSGGGSPERTTTSSSAFTAAISGVFPALFQQVEERTDIYFPHSAAVGIKTRGVRDGDTPHTSDAVEVKVRITLNSKQDSSSPILESSSPSFSSTSLDPLPSIRPDRVSFQTITTWMCAECTPCHFPTTSQIVTADTCTSLTP
jgi:hypothetical protein